MIILSILLTWEADKISRVYPNFSSNTVGAILLGITTSLPEVVTTFELISKAGRKFSYNYHKIL